MSSWLSLLERRCDPNDHAAVDAWFTQIADRLLNGARLTVGTEAHRFVEVEFYYYGEGHADPFTHRDPLQLECGRWYFHRTRGEYRGGSFKGLDLTFGDGKAFGGVLIRGIERPDGVLVDGPSLCVDHLLDRTGAADVATLDRAIGKRRAWEAGNPLLLGEGSPGEPRTVYRSARVGLSLKRSRKSPEPPRFVMRTYRFFTLPRVMSKGKPHMVLALHAQGLSPEAIRELTGCTKQAIARYIADFEEGRREGTFDPYFGIDLGPKELCRLHGVWHARHGAVAEQAKA